MQVHAGQRKERGWAAIVAKMGEAARRYDYLPIAADTGMSWAASTHTLFLQLTEAAWGRARDAGERYTRGTHRRYWRAQLQRAQHAAPCFYLGQNAATLWVSQASERKLQQQMLAVAGKVQQMEALQVFRRAFLSFSKL